MVNVRKQTGRAMSMPGGLAVGAAVSIGWSVIGAMIMAKLIDTETMPETAIGYGSIVILVTASFLGAMAAHSKIKRLRVQVCLMAGGIYYLILLATTALFFGGQYTGMGVTAAMVMSGSAAAILPGLQSRGGQKRRSYKIPGR